MTQRIVSYALAIMLLGMAGSNLSAETIREPAVAGRFYPKDAQKLKNAVMLFMGEAANTVHQKPVALVAPHAGYVYSGQIAADAYRQAAAHRYDLVVLLGAPHAVPVNGVSIYSGTGYRTPLGVAEIDQQTAKELIDSDPRFFFNPEAHQKEHSLEVQVPFVQVLFPNAKLVTALIGTHDRKIVSKFGKTLATALKTKNALIVASTDLSHYPRYDDAVRVDAKTLAAFRSMAPATIEAALREHGSKQIPNLATSACGETAVWATVVAAKHLGADCARIVSYANSGDSTLGSHDRVVGYGAMSLSRDPECRTVPKSSSRTEQQTSVLTTEQKRRLLELARKTIEHALHIDMVPFPRSDDRLLVQPRGAFVTLKKNGRLRGCIGHMAENMPLCQVVSAMALQAAFNDRRFAQLRADELETIDIEISVLTPFRQVSDAGSIRVGIDGVRLKKGDRVAVFLPQVATEQGWDRGEMLDQLCRKASLPAGSWKEGARLYTFQAEIFSESELAHHISSDP
ncbi:COG2078: Uncharacterized ACR [Olavius algarvensis associated proteobacterium Delta 3]|nr:COG2078: Uncharacterized ACR [Olavius algarvensis associated proteobacterium Delta 3]